ncbi:hypothetical protein V6N11_071492 [Hibiscus sabdariffa]|uniref:Uncharacterized protein n=1 Tax=Hibiscus sabdariffa TaxID=183260 RepID=A0ABR2U084_9ROSI
MLGGSLKKLLNYYEGETTEWRVKGHVNNDKDVLQGIPVIKEQNADVPSTQIVQTGQTSRLISPVGSDIEKSNSLTHAEVILDVGINKVEGEGGDVALEKEFTTLEQASSSASKKKGVGKGATGTSVKEVLQGLQTSSGCSFVLLLSLPSCLTLEGGSLISR